MRKYLLLLSILFCIFLTGCNNNDKSDIEKNTKAIEETHIMKTSPLSNEEMKISGYFHMKQKNHPATWIELREDRTYWENEENTSYKRWELKEDKLIINHYSSDGEFIGENVFSFKYVNENTFMLIYDDLQYNYTCTRVEPF